MLAKRLLVINILIPCILFFIIIGGWPFTALMLVSLVWAGWEYWRIFHNGGYSPSLAVLIAGIVALVLGRMIWNLQYSDLIVSLLVLTAMSTHVLQFERGHKQSAVDLGITLGGILYFGWLGSYFISIRNLSNGLWWALLVLPAVWFADAGAYFFGSWLGKHPMSPVTSPKKTWEGYIGGIGFSALCTSLLAALWNLQAPIITPLKGLVIGIVLSIITPLGDLTESMIKRQFGVKDSGKALPGHGGVMDRIDSWLWAAVIGYYLVIAIS